MTDLNVLVVEDDPDIGRMLDRGLGSAGFAVKWVDNASDAMRHVASQAPGAVLLDVMLPDGTGNDVCRSLRQGGFAGPILFLSAKDEVADRVEGLAAGGDDYIVKPFSFDELVARLRAQLLRREALDKQVSVPEVGGLTLDPETRHARFRDVVARLTQREADLLALFMSAPNKPISRGEIFDRLWLEQGSASLNVVDVYIGYLRGKLHDIVKAGGPTISTVRGRGFMLEFGS
jgi:two-component system, OmpR family, response regulator